MSVFASTHAHFGTTSSARAPARVSALLEQEICAEVIRRLAVHRLDIAIAAAEAVASGSDERGAELGRLLTPTELLFVSQTLADVLSTFGAPMVQA
jgi:hypothetical protein